tara:strand:- start:3368 stop:4339 length:972 start_codon:yes stop_codon:yes gene_type:complete
MTKTIITPVVSGETYDVKVRARTMAGKYSAYSATSQITIPTYSTAPAVPTSPSATSDPLSITIKWTNPADKDLKGVEIYYSTSSGSGFSLLTSIDGVPSTAQEFDWNYEDALSLNQTYYFKIRSVNTSGVASGYTSEVSAQFSTIATGDVTMNAISNISGSIVTYNSNAESTTQDAITYSANGTGSDSTTFNGYMVSEITLGAIDSSIAGFLINANALASKRTIGTAKYAYAIVLQKLPTNAFWTKAAASGNYAVFLGTGDATGQSSTEGIQGSFSSSFLDDATGVTGTTGSKYGLFLYEPTETTDQYWVFGGTGLTVTELKR